MNFVNSVTGYLLNILFELHGAGMKKRIALSLLDPKAAASVGKALSSEMRLNILKLLVDKACNISEISKHFDIPLSTAALHVKALEEAGMVICQESPGVRGTQKLCGIAFEDIYFNVFAHKKNKEPFRSVVIPVSIGNYFDCRIASPCGIVNETGYIGCEDSPDSFYKDNRLTAQLIWFEQGYLEYRIPTAAFRKSSLSELEFSMELCSEAPGYSNDWPSDITVWVNHTEIATLRSKGDYGGRRGRYNPDWWSDTQTQYGLLKTIRVNSLGTFDDPVKCSDVTLKDLHPEAGGYISLQIGVKKDAANVGGLNLFGEKFGDYPQAIIVKAKLDS